MAVTKLVFNWAGTPRAREKLGLKLVGNLDDLVMVMVELGPVRVS